MSNVTQFGDEDGGNRLSEVGDGVVPEVVDAVALLLDLLADSDGGLSAPDRSLLRLRETGSRLAAVMDLAREFCPPEASPEEWFGWMTASPSSPMPESAFVPSPREAVSRRMSRSVSRLEARQAEVRDLEARLETARGELAATRRMDAGIIQVAALKAMRDAMREMFSMGPAWVIMRSLSAHVGDAEVARDGLAGKALSDLRERRESESVLAMRTLDFYAGDAAFESALREAVLSVARRFDAASPAARRSGRRYRTRARMDVSVNPRSRDEARGILDGIPVPERGPVVSEDPVPPSLPPSFSGRQELADDFNMDDEDPVPGPSAPSGGASDFDP